MKRLLLFLFSVIALGVNAQTYCSAGPSSTADSEITGVYLVGDTDTISNIDSTCGTTGVQNFTSIHSADVSVGGTYSVDITMGTCNGTYSGAIAAWIDFNSDGDFLDAGELLGTYGGSPTTTQTFSFTVPAGATLGTTRMRVMQQENGTTAGMAPCNTFSWGSVEDYAIDIDTLYSPSCLAPTFSSITTTDSSATLSWVSNGSSFVVEYGANGFLVSNGTQVTVSDTFAVITGLSSNTDYDFYVKTNCTASSNGYSSNLGPFTATTLCSAAATPLFENFDNDSTGSFSNTNAPSCWYYEEDAGASGYGYITGSTFSLSPRSGNNMYYLYNSFDASLEALISPAITGLDSGTKQMEVYLANTGFSSGNDVVVGTVSGPNGLSNFSAIDTLSVPNGATWTQFTVYFDSLGGYNMTDKHIAIVTTTTSTFSAVYIDDIEISNAPSCLPPSAISAGTVTLDSALISYSTNGIATWLEYGPTGFTPDFTQGTGVKVSVSSSPYWLTGLDSNTTYDVYVYQMCADSTMSAAFGPATFKTQQCSPLYTCDIEIELTDSYGDGWNGAEVQILNASGGVEYTLGSAFTSGSSYTDSIQLCTGETFTIEVSSAGSYPSEIGLNVTSNGSNIASYSNTSSTTTGTVMAQFISNCAPCTSPSPVTIGYVGLDSAEVTYSSTGIATYLEYGPAGFVPNFSQSTGTVVTVSSSPYWLTSLDSNTAYDVYIYQMCADSTLSLGAGPTTFATAACSPAGQCSIDIELTDSYGDGWNGALVNVVSSAGAVQYTLGAGFTTGSSYTETISVCSGETFTIEVSDAGSFPSEIGLNVIQSGSVIASYTNTFGTAVGTVMATFTSNCNVACPTPTNLTYVAGKNDATFNFDLNGGSANYIYEWGPVGFIQATGATITSIDSTTSNNFTITGLSAGQCYDVIVIGDCGASGVTDTLGPLTFCTNLCDTSDQCSWNMIMNDSYGDGWNGAEVQVLYNGVFGQSFTLASGSSDTVNFDVCSGTQITVVNTAAGSWPSEVSYTLSNASGTQSTSVTTGNFATGVQDTLMANCVTLSCPTPTNLATTNLGATSADIIWTGGSGTFMYDYRAQGSLATMSGTSTTAIASLTGLTPSTTYDFFVKEVCGTGDTSLTMYHSFTTDSCAAVVLGNPQFNVDSVTATYAATTFNWSSSNATGFNISFGDGNSSNGTGGTITHSYTANGNYTVTLTVYNDCDTVNTTFSVQVSTIGLEENGGITSLLIYPNPTQGMLSINGEISTDSEVSIRIINYLGQEILVDQFDPTSSVLSKTYDLSSAAAGAYLIEVATDRGVVQKSIIVRH